MMAVGCTKDFDYKGPQEPTSFLSVSPADDIYVTHEGIPWILMPQIKVITDVYMWDWKASTHEVWCGVEASNPQGYFRVHVSKNDTSEDREAVITVSAENAPSVYIKVHQSVSPILSISPSAAQEVPKDGGTLSVAVKSIASWSIESDSPWAVVHTQSGEGDGSVEISVAPNPGYRADIATITFRSGETIRKLKINRAGNPEGTYLLIWQGGYRVVPLSGETLTIEVTSNTSWEVSSDQTWARSRQRREQGTDLRVYLWLLPYMLMSSRRTSCSGRERSHMRLISTADWLSRGQLPIHRRARNINILWKDIPLRWSIRYLGMKFGKVIPHELYTP